MARVQDIVLAEKKKGVTQVFVYEHIIRDMFLIESGFIGLMGGVVGIVLSLTISKVINVLYLRSNAAMYAVSTGDISRIPMWLLLLALIFAVLVGMLAGLFPALRAMRLSPLTAIRNE